MNSKTSLIALVCVLHLAASIAVAASPREKALAAVAVAGARVAVANQKPELRDTTNRFFNARLDTLDALEGELQVTRKYHSESLGEIEKYKQDWIPRPPTPIEEPQKVAEASTISAGEIRIPMDECGCANRPLWRPMQLEFSMPARGQEFERFAVTTYTADGIPEETWCAPCNDFHRVNKDGDSRIRITYSTSEPPRVWERGHWRRARLPFTTWIDGNGKLTFHEGFINLDDLWAKINKPENVPPNSRGYSASGVAGTFQARAQVEQAFSHWRTYIGTTKADGTPVKVRAVFRRTGGQTFPLLHAKPEQWSFKNIFGDLGEFVFEAPGSKLPVDPIRLGYRRDRNRIRLTGEIEVDETQFGLPGDYHPQNGFAAAEPAGFGPLTLLTVVSVIRDIVAIMNPTCDLTLGGQVSATAFLDDSRNCLQIDFEEAPRIKLVVLFPFDLGVRQLVLSPDNLHIEFDGSMWVKSRDFRVE